MSRDEFEHYDLSEFTEEELVQFDTDATYHLLHKPNDGPEIPPISQQGIQKASSSSFGGGPALDIAFESPTDSFLVEDIPKCTVSEKKCHSASTSLPLQLTSVHVSRMRLPKQDKSPYERFCSWKKGFSVTDLVSPVWCEVQYEYGLYGERHRPLERRPSSFISRNGKEIQVQQKVAQHNDRTLKRGASIHKALEREVRPEIVPIRITTDEERWALRLFNLTAGLEQLVLDGRTRELPVFGVTHGQIVFGIIDEVTRCIPSEVHERHNPIKRSSVSSKLSPAKKKQRRLSSPSKQRTHTFFSIPEETRIPEQLSSDEKVHDTSLTGNSTPRVAHPQPTFYDLTLIDYKTRRAPSLPPEEDTVSSQLQLMLYHRMLSALLLPETFDFDALWTKQGINPHRSFSRSFVEDIGWLTGNEKDFPEFHVDLCSMVAAWVSVVHSARNCGEPLRGINPELHIIYRKASVEKTSSHSLQKKPENGNEAVDIPLEVLALQEELNIARAIEESLRSINQEAEEAGTVTQAVTKNALTSQGEEPVLDEVVDLTSPAPDDDPELRLAVQDSLPARTSNIPNSETQPIVMKECEGIADEMTSLEDEDKTLPDRTSGFPDEDASGFSMILGSKKFFMNDNRLDEHLEDVLRWWFGIRPPRGVELAQSGRSLANIETVANGESRKPRRRILLSKRQALAASLHRSFTISKGVMENNAIWSRNNAQTNLHAHFYDISNRLSLILAIVVALSVGQFFFEYFDTTPANSTIYDRIRDPLLNSESEDDSYTLPMRSKPTRTRPKTKLKPEAILIHPGDSNLARADAAAQELGIASDTERVKLNRYSGDQDAWEYGKGRDIARQLLGGTAQHSQSPQGISNDT
ncbi:hypothetical protein AZE42_05193 [Rhizopogon vesiculosus]|uniref:Uncharacterized protein n=1 Tax=Rhizopogon vesiculosus TaxID=180088 RepID=A0A1J8PP77_9AGAM|nr:hypothetical protein AZE42_05193 [Rhizopogon vesiculosus]